ncbi:DUF2563 family protein [Actinomadura rugatobispora]|uniref:DUF2563 family protein n=1 Tax=Actinomadura rugatobispora TaxID=1994 RepID=A0ABW1AD72_9ACTN|nr:hypothetical protein GCM10010200_030440 [Actinomadura rugatobispora]
MNPIEVRRRRLRQMAGEMERDLTELRAALDALAGGSKAAGRIGGWDVAQQLGWNLDSAHQNMVRGLRDYCDAYQALITRLQRAAENYERTEAAAADRARAVQGGGGTGVVPWQHR